MNEYDIVVVGGGPGGYVAAIKAAQTGRKVCLVEKGKLGGVCLNQGCIPTKTLLKTVEVFDLIKESRKFAVNVQAEPEIDLTELQKRKNAVVKQLTDGVGLLLKSNGADVINEQAVFIDAQTLKAGEKEIRGKDIIIATGSVPFSLPVKIGDGSKIIHSEQALELTELPKRLAIIGGGVIGIEFAYIYRSMGSEVTVIERLEEILPMFDEDIIRESRKRMKKTGVDIHTSAEVTAIDGGSVSYREGNAEKTLEADLILIAVGRKPYLDGYGLENTGVEFTKSGIVTDDRLRTNIPGIYAIGDINGRSMLAHTASMEGIIAVKNICGETAAINYERIPSCVYITPEIASVGLTEKQAKEKYREVKVGRFPLSANGKSLVEGNNSGFIKVLVDPKYDEIVGAHIFGIHATDMIGGIANAINAEASSEDVTMTVYPHPSVSEIIPEAFHAAHSKAIHSL